MSEKEPIKSKPKKRRSQDMSFPRRYLNIRELTAEEWQQCFPGRYIDKLRKKRKGRRPASKGGRKHSSEKKPGKRHNKR